MLGVDRLDMIKGIPQKLLAFEKFLDEHPEWAEKVLLVQIAVPSRVEVPEYQARPACRPPMAWGALSAARWHLSCPALPARRIAVAGSQQMSLHQGVALPGSELDWNATGAISTPQVRVS